MHPRTDFYSTSLGQSGYVLATDQAARRWHRIAPFLVGSAFPVPVAYGIL